MLNIDRKELLKQARELDHGYSHKTFKVTYLGPTNTRGSRVKIKDCNQGKNITIPFNDECKTSTECAIMFLIEHEFKVLGVVNSGSKDNLIICDWTVRSL